MFIPDPALAAELEDICKCGNEETPVAVDGKSDTPIAIYKCSSCFAFWQSSFHRSYAKDLPDVSVGSAHASNHVQADPIPATIHSYTPPPTSNPKCMECGRPLGEGHSPSCPYFLERGDI